MEQPQQTPAPSNTPSNANTQAEFVTLKVVVPSSSVSKTVRLPVKIKVKELHEILTKKLSTLANAPQHIYEDYGFYWHSESGPVWLAETATLRAYNFKPNVSIEFKRRVSSPPTSAPPTPKAHKKGKKEKETQTSDLSQAAQPTQAPAEPPRVSAVRKMSAWVSSRPGSLYEKKGTPQELKKERSQSVTLLPRKDPDAVVNAARFTSPSYSSTFESSTSPTPTLTPLFDTPVPPSPRSANPATLDDLDDLIDIFDDLVDDPFSGGDEFSDERLLEEYAATIEQEDLGSAGELSDTELSPRFTYAEDDTSSPVNETRQRSYSSPYGSDRYPLKQSPSTSPRHSGSPEGTSLEPKSEEDRKMPGLRGAGTKRDPNPAASTGSVRVAAATSILEDALESIETQIADMDLMKRYITSALNILKTLT